MYIVKLLMLVLSISYFLSSSQASAESLITWHDHEAVSGTTDVNQPSNLAHNATYKKCKNHRYYNKKHQYKKRYRKKIRHYRSYYSDYSQNHQSFETSLLHYTSDGATSNVTNSNEGIDNRANDAYYPAHYSSQYKKKKYKGRRYKCNKRYRKYN